MSFGAARLILGVITVASLMHAGAHAADDEAVCRDETLRATRVEACTRLIQANFKADAEALAKRYEARAAAYSDQGLYAAAIQDQSEVIGRRPMSAEARLARGISYFQYQALDKALLDFDNAVTLKPGYQDALFWRGRTNRFLKQFDAALSDLNKALELSPKDGDALFVRGRTYADIDNLERAIADYTAALAINPKNRGALYNRAGIYRSVRNFDAAMRDLDACFGAAPDDPACYDLKGHVLADMGDLPGASSAYGQAIARAPGEAALWRNRAGTYRQLKNFPAAIADLTEAIGIDPAHARTLYDRAWLNAASNRLQDAVADYAQVIVLDPKGLGPNAHYERALTHLIAGDLKAANADLLATHKAFPKNASVALWLYVTETRAVPSGVWNMLMERPAVTRLRTSLKDLSAFPEHSALINVMLGQASAATAFPAAQAAIAKRAQDQKDNMCFFYAVTASHYLGVGDIQAARITLERGQGTDAVFSLSCYVMRAELARLRRSAPAAQKPAQVSLQQ